MGEGSEMICEDIGQRVAKLEAWKDTAQSQISRLFHKLDGNGQKGLEERVTTLEAAKSGAKDILNLLLAIAAVAIALFK